MKNLILLLLAFTLASCEQPDKASPETSGRYLSMESAPAADMRAQKATAPVQNTKKIIKTGDLTLRVASVGEMYQKVKTRLQEYDAYIENEFQSTYEQRIQYTLSIRVPSTSFDSLFNALADEATVVENLSVRMDDVTERYYDLETRLKNKKALEVRYLELLKQAKTVEDIVEIERNLNEVRTQIEVEQGQFDYLSKQINMSTINLSFYEVLPYRFSSEFHPGIGERIKESLNQGWHAFTSFLIWTIGMWPFALLIVLFFTFVRKLRRRRRR